MATRQRNLQNIPPGTCVCSTCKIEKVNTEFSWYNNRNTRDGYRLQVNTICRSCSKKTSKELKVIKEQAGEPPEFGQPCECCKRPVYKNKSTIPQGINGTYSWQCDHDHKTKQFRGWICKPCNTGIGSLGDDIESLERCLGYLKNNP